MNKIFKLVLNKKLQKSVFTSGFALFYFIFASLTPSTVLAEGNPFIPTTDTMDTGLTPQIGGNTLVTASQNIAAFKDITGAYYDSSLDRIVFVGRTDGAGPTYSKDDMAVAIQSIFFNGTLPDVNIGDDPNNPSSSSAVVTYSGGIQGTNLGSVLFNADYKLKQYVIGYNPNSTQVTSAVSSYKSVVDRYVQLNPNPIAGNQTKFILSPQSANIKNASSANAFVFNTISMQATTQQVNPNNDPQWDQAATDFANDLTTNYDQYAQESASLAQAKQIAKIVAVLKWISDNNIPTDFSWAQNYNPETVSTPSTVQKVTTPVFGNGYSAQGQVNFNAPNTYIPDDGTASGIKSASQAVSTAKDDITWTFTNGGQQYSAVAVSADAFKSLGGYSTQVADISVPISGDLNLSFERTYSSFSSAQLGIGIGWEFIPARIRDNNYPQSINITTCNNELYITQLALNTKYGHETFTYNCSNGYTADSASYHSKVVQNQDGSIIVTVSDQTKYQFNDNFQLTFIQDKNGNKINYSYDGSDKLTTIADTQSHQLTLEYNNQDLIKSVTDWTNRKVEYSYDSSGRLTGVKDPNGHTTTYGYDSNSKLTTYTDRSGQLVLTNTYGSDSRLATIKDAANITKTNTYDNNNRIVTQTDSNGRVVTTKYDPNARILQQTDPDGKSMIYTYGIESVPLTQKDKKNHTTTFVYDSNGNVTSVTFPDSSNITYTFDSGNRITKVTDGRYGTPAKETTYTYDTNGNQTEKNEAGFITQYTYNTAGEPLTLEDPLDHMTTWTRDTLGNILTESDSYNNTATFTYDSLGRLIKHKDASNIVVSYNYDANGNLLSKTDGSGTTAFDYDNENRLDQATLPGNLITEYTYNSSGSMTSAKDPLNNTTTYGLDSYQNLTTQEDALNNETTNIFDTLNRQTQSTTPLGKVLKWEYDANGNITKRTDANNSATTYAYNNLDQLTTITYPNSSTVTFEYDARGNRTKMIDPIGTSTFAYDKYDRLTQATNAYTHVIKYEYDNAGNMTKITYPDNAVATYTYDNNNRMVTAKDWNNKTTTYTYNANGTLATKALPNTITAAYSYDRSNKLADIIYKKSTTTLAQFNYVRDDLGNITRAVEQGAFVQAPSGNTFYGEYFDNQTLSGKPKYTRLDSSINFNWGTGTPNSLIPANNFSVRWTRAVSFAAGTYTFTSTSDDGARLYIDGEMIYDNWSGSGLTTVTTKKELSAGTHIIVYEYQENTSNARASLSYSSTTNPYAAQYFNNKTLTGSPTLTRNDTAINFNWAAGSPGSGIPTNNFSARWTRTANFADGNYTFNVTADDGVRLYIDNTLILDKWFDVPSVATYSATQNLTSGNHIIKMEYYEATGSAVATLNYQQTPYAAEYFDNQILSGTPAVTRQENGINNTWNAGSPDAAIPSDHFSARWSRTQNFAAGVYQFTTTADDGVRLYIDNKLVLDKWFNQGPTTYTTTQSLTSGNHTIKMEYFEDTGTTATAKLQYQQVAPQFITTYVYDAAGKITNALYPSNETYAYTYDKVGNRLTQTINDPTWGPSTETYVYDDDNKLIAIDSHNDFTYDNNGNMTYQPVLSPNPGSYNTFDYENRMTQHHNANTLNTYNHIYDGFGNKLRTEFSTTLTRYITDMSGDLPRTLATDSNPNGPGGVSTKYFYGISPISQNGTSYYIEDGLTNVRFMADSSGNLSSNYDYDAYGGPRDNVPGGIGFQQQWKDSGSGYYYLRARYYDPGIGRFISRDPYAGSIQNPLSQNPYIYAHDNPVNLTDPSGNNALAIGSMFLAASPALIAVGDAINQDIKNGDYVGAADKATWLVPWGTTGKVTYKMSAHAIKRLAERNITGKAVSSLMKSSKPFNYYHEGTWKKGYYDTKTGLFIGVKGDTITTVIDNVKPNYINNLKKAKP